MQIKDVTMEEFEKFLNDCITKCIQQNLEEYFHRPTYPTYPPFNPTWYGPQKPPFWHEIICKADDNYIKGEEE